MEIFDLESETHLSSCHKNVFAIITLAIIILAIYSNTFHASWHFDDEANILKNEPLHLKEISWQNIKKTFFASLGGGERIYRPVACFTLALNYYLGGDDVVGYHLVNICIHILASVFLFLFIYHTLNLPAIRARYGPNSYFIALLATALWAINPLQTQAITYIVQRMASMAGMFYIMSMYCYLKARLSEQNSSKAAFYILCSIAAILSFGSKENAAMLPISIFLFELFLIQGLPRENVKRNFFLFPVVILIPLALALILKGPSILSIKQVLSDYGIRDRGFTLLERLLTEPRVLVFYITLLLYPMPDRLCVTHDISKSQNLFSPPTTIISILFIFIILSLAIIRSRKWPFISYCIIFYFLNHLIESTIFPLELIFEHRNYIPSMLFFVPIAILALKAIQFFSYKRSMQVILSTFVVLVLIAQGHSTFMRNFIWKTEESLWVDAVDKSPNHPRAHHNLGRYYSESGQKEKAIAEYEMALKLERALHAETDHWTNYNLALEYIDSSQEDKAIEHLGKAVEIAPRFPAAYNNLAVLMIKKGKYDEAFDYLIKALTYDNKSYSAHSNLGFVLLKKRRLEEAITEFRYALAGEKDFLPALYGLGIIYKYKTEFGKARYYLRRALEKKKRDVMTRLHLIETLSLMMDEESLKTLLAETVRIIPPERVNEVIENIAADKIPDDEAPDLGAILPLLGKAYMERSEMLANYGYHYLEKGRENLKELHH
jgi:tetratricopeptide (TPR) repeat protein